LKFNILNKYIKYIKYIEVQYLRSYMLGYCIHKFIILYIIFPVLCVKASMTP